MFEFTNVLTALRRIFIPRTYASDLEEYIESRRPQSTSDIDQYSREYNQKISKGKWL